MRIAQLVAGLFALVAGQPRPADAADAADAAPEDGQGSYYSGAEWVLDAEGHIIASSAVLMERALVERGAAYARARGPGPRANPLATEVNCFGGLTSRAEVPSRRWTAISPRTCGRS